MLVRAETPADRAAVYALNMAAFDTPAEARLVDALREQARPMVSLVADDGGVDGLGICGHILFSPVTLEDATPLLMGLAPLAVSPSRQGQGLGSALVCAGLHACPEIGAVAVVILGDPGYYGRFGFLAASRFGLRCVYTESGDIPADAFMLLELRPGALDEHQGMLRYHPAFDAL